MKIRLSDLLELDEIIKIILIEVEPDISKVILITAGGSGGHVTPLVAVAARIKKLDPGSKIIYVGQKGDNMVDVVRSSADVDQIHLIYAGKFRRFNGEGFKQLLDLPDLIKNVRDAILVMIGTLQSIYLIRKLKPDVMFSRGGYVCVPVGIGCRLNKVPYITHDSDPIPSLANRIIAGKAKYNLVALPKEIYPYQQNKTITTGIPVSEDFKYVNAEDKANFLSNLGYSTTTRMILVIGGGLGSMRVNLAIAAVASQLLKEYPKVVIVNITGKGNYKKLDEIYNKKLGSEDRKRIVLKDFIDNVYVYSGASELIITRAGATNLAEFALQAKACIVVPSPFLVAGHQLKSAEVLASTNSAEIADEELIIKKPEVLLGQIKDLLNDPDQINRLSENIHKLAINDAAEKIAKIVLE